MQICMFCFKSNPSVHLYILYKKKKRLKSAHRDEMIQQSTYIYNCDIIYNFINNPSYFVKEFNAQYYLNNKSFWVYKNL